MNHPRNLAALAFAAALIVSGSSAGAVTVSPAGMSRIDGLSVLELVQNKPKAETMKHRAKRIWRDLTGYKFDVACPAFPIVLTRTTCTATGKNREEARAKCQSQHAFCQIRDASR